MLSDFVLRQPAAIFLRREITRARAGNLGHKKSRNHSRGSEGGLQTDPKKLVSSLIRSMARPLPTPYGAGLDESEKAGLLTSRSFYFAGLTEENPSG